MIPCAVMAYRLTLTGSKAPLIALAWLVPSLRRALCRYHAGFVPLTLSMKLSMFGRGLSPLSPSTEYRPLLFTVFTESLQFCSVQIY